jgi:UDP-N-acetylmuramate dehydrogenase
MIIQQNISLKPYNTFGIEASARFFTTFQSAAQLQEILESKVYLQSNQQKLILGGGSNVLLTQDVDAWVLKNEITGIEKIMETTEYVYVKAGAGVQWHNLVMHCIENDWAGMENLALIPGNAGASPMQNIGAYGIEIKDIFFSLEAFHLETKTIQVFHLKDCAFGYRESVFKNTLKAQFVILSVTYQLYKTPKFNTAYGAIEQELQRMGINDFSIQAIAQAVINIRSSKLPDPALIGNAGSFFKNPEISLAQFEDLKAQFPEIVGYPLPNHQVKLAAGWLIEKAGFKGYRVGDAGCHAQQALVLVNYGNATGNQIFQLSETIIAAVQEKFNVLLYREVNII